MKELEEKIDHLYQSFFDTVGINKETGILNERNLRFATKIAIGEEYLDAKERILFVSFDMGKDEKFVDKNLNSYQDFEERRNAISEPGFSKNPHMAGTYATALYFLREKYNYEREWDILEKQNQFFREALITNSSQLPSLILNKISLINFYNFVTIGRHARTGGHDRFLINQSVEIKLLIDIINTIEPNIIVVQSNTLKNHFSNFVKPNISPTCKIYVGYHPSIFGRGIKYRKPNNYIRHLIANEI